MKPNYHHVHLVVDRSGSMGGTRNDTIGGFNSLLSDQRKVPGEVTVSLSLFSTRYEPQYSFVPIAHVADLSALTYVCDGWTALNDALAKAITDTGAALAAKPESERPSKVTIVVMTDGEENRSSDYAGYDGRRRVMEMVKHQKEKYNWEFVFIGANIDSFTTAAAYGIDRGFAVNYHADSLGTTNAFSAVSRGLATSRIKSASGDAVMSYFDGQNTIDNTKLDTTPIQSVIDSLTDADKGNPTK